jgi:hypothetical protein
MLASAVAAQGRSAADTKTVEGYRLTMPVLRKVLPALYAQGAESCPRDSRDPRALGIAEIAQMIERCPATAQALQRAGVTSREAALVTASLYRTMEAVALRRGDASAVDQGPLRDNALLLEKNDPEVKRLMRQESQS